MRIVKLLDKVLRGVINFMEILAELAACVLAIVVIWGVILTYGFGRSDVFSVEISEYILVFICFASIAYVLKEDQHVKMKLFVEKLPPRPRLGVDIIASFLSLIFCVIVAWKSTEVMLLNYNRGFCSSSLVSFPMWIPYLVIAFGSFLLVLQYIVHIRKLADRLKTTPKSTKRFLKKGEI